MTLLGPQPCRRLSAASSSIVVALCATYLTFPAAPHSAAPGIACIVPAVSGNLRLRRGRKKCQHVKVGARDYDDAHAARDAMGAWAWRMGAAAVVAASIAVQSEMYVHVYSIMFFLQCSVVSFTVCLRSVH